MIRKAVGQAPFVRTAGVALMVLAVASCGGGPAETRSSSSTLASGSASAAKPSAASPASSTQPQSLTKITMGLSTVDYGYLPYIVARDKGFFRDEGLDVQVSMMAANASVAAAVNHQIDLTVHTSAELAAAQGAPLKAFMFYFYTSTFQLSSRPEYKQPQDMIGKTIGGFAPGGAGDRAAKLIVQKELGLDPTQVNYIAIPETGARVAALVAGQIFGAIGNPDVAALLESQGMKTIASSAKVYPIPFSGLAAHDDFLKAKPDVIRGFLRANIRAIQFIAQNQDETAKVAANALQMSEGVAKRALPLTLQAINLDDPLGLSQQGLTNTIDDIKAQTKLESVPPDKIIDVSLLREVQRQMGINCKGGYQC